MKSRAHRPSVLPRSVGSRPRRVGSRVLLVSPGLLRAGLAGLVLVALLVGCGGSSSETPYPLEPLPRAAKAEPQADASSQAESKNESSGTGGGRP